MALITFELDHGLKAVGSGDEPLLYREVGLRELTTNDLIDAQLAAEKVVVHPGGKAVAYTSDVLYGLELLRRQIAYIGEVQGPIEIKMIRKLHTEDFDLIQRKAQELDQALAEDLARRIEERGRADPVR
ncbi:phage tail assembly protein [Aeromonas allosaccharophila]|uniref:phage tail assembly protein n=1 Tax=Aeromonas allosaccharophila TaxID=656 RepID=UPI001F2945AB|nr:phage tail assembly protein [Aeromonas allosaccharophila]MCE9848405.1 phage tail assembly protein [Aeromonas allosaccharophila]